jgi:hypothetical protein
MDLTVVAWGDILHLHGGCPDKRLPGSVKFGDNSGEGRSSVDPRYGPFRDKIAMSLEWK